MPRKHLMESAIVLRTPQRQHLIAVDLVPPGTGAFQANMTDEFVRRFHPPTTQGIAAATKLAIMGPAPMLTQINPAIVNRFESLVGGRLAIALKPPCWLERPEFGPLSMYH